MCRKADVRKTSGPGEMQNIFEVCIAVNVLVEGEHAQQGLGSSTGMYWVAPCPGLGQRSTMRNVNGPQQRTKRAQPNILRRWRNDYGRIC
jgi:hypothetical protein